MKYDEKEWKNMRTRRGQEGGVDRTEIQGEEEGNCGKKRRNRKTGRVVGEEEREVKEEQMERDKENERKNWTEEEVEEGGTKEEEKLGEPSARATAFIMNLTPGT
jgi:hypothetical protein